MRLPVEVLGTEALSTPLVKKRPVIGSRGRNPTHAIGQEPQFSYVLVLHSWPGLTVRRSVPPGVRHGRRTESAFGLRSRHLPPVSSLGRLILFWGALRGYWLGRRQ